MTPPRGGRPPAIAEAGRATEPERPDTAVRDDRHTAVHGRRVLRVLGRGSVLLLAFLLLPGAVYLGGSTAYEHSRYAPAEPTQATTVATAAALAGPVPAHDPGKPTAVIVVGDRGANVSDALAPYDVLATSGAFNVYTVAPRRRALPLLGGLDLVPDLSFAELAGRLGGAAPDVTVVPEMPASDGDAAVTSWLRETASGGLVLGVCTGARLVADAGLLTGRDATSHWFRLAGLETRHPEVRWQRGTRYVDDGDVITTGGLLSSVDGTLRAIERLRGPDVAARAADAVGWPSYSPGRPAPLPVSRLSPTDAAVHLLNVGFRADTTTVGVALSDGVGELELASAFAPYGEARSARTLAVAAGGGVVRSRHGLAFVPRADLRDAADRVDRVVVPGRQAARQRSLGAAGVPVAYLHSGPGFAFDAALADMAVATDARTARWAGKILEYPATGLPLGGDAWPWGPVLRVLALGAAGAAAALGVATLVRRRRNRRSGRP